MENAILLILLLLILFVPTFLMQRRQRRQLEKITSIQEALTIGEEVVTTAGIHALVRGISESEVVLEIAQGMEVTFEKTAVVRSLTKERAAVNAGDAEG